ncbi:MAG: quinoprotein dehydrogenase-associated SoxYZ-like carrier [Burkholderiales bacterium]|nr:quinoprotein dehydrogenase-associated SoxYZ-like carrier [Burkholderiales bacterium]
MRRRMAGVLWLSLALLAGQPDAEAANFSDEPSWLRIKPLLFGDRPVRDDSDAVLELFVSAQAEDASVVPVMVRTRLAQTAQRYISRIWLIVDENPSPFGVQFELTPLSGRADIETRVRMESSSPIRAVAELNDGSLWMSAKLVIGAGGCSAPVSRSATAQNLGRMKLRVEDQFAEPGEPVLAQLNVMHPQFSGMASNVRMDPHYVRQVDVYYGQQRILRANVDFTISENPVFRFYFQPQAEGELRAEAVDSTELRFEEVLRYTPKQ